MKLNIVVLASGGGTNFQAIIDACESGKLDATVAGLITNRYDAGALERARAHQIPYAVIRQDEFSSFHSYVEAFLKSIEQWSPSVVALAGYFAKIPAEIINEISVPMINIHPSLLPKYGGKGFYGKHIHRAVVENKETESGCTVHLVDEEFDTGRILRQARVQVQPEDTPEELSARIRPHEHRILVETIEQILKQQRDS